MSWFVVGGVAIGATAGAIAGSKEGGDDVWKGALIGGAIGGTAGYAAAPAAAGAAPAAGAAVAPEAAGIVGGTAFGGTGAATVGAVGGMAPEAAAVAGGAGSAGILGAGGAGTAGAGGFAGGAGTAGGVSGLYGSGAGLGSSVVPSAYSGVGSGLTAGSSAGLPSVASGAGGATGSSVGAAGFAPGMQAPIQMAQAPVTTPPPEQSSLSKGFESAKAWLSEPKNAMLTGVLGLGALSMFNSDNEDNFGGSNVQQAGYPLSPNFRPSRYQPTRNYADGGITSIGPQMGMFPQSQYDKTQFATPSQMPISREVVSADYDTLVDPYTGEMPHFAKGGDTSKYQAMIDPKTHVREEKAPRWVGESVANVNDPGIFIDRDSDTAHQDPVTAAQTLMGKAAARSNTKLVAMQKPKPLGKVNLGPVAGAEEERKAVGGIASLGSYAHGGNARLLKGPGDGMSDDIPATIGGSQPAALADGEFVVPADVVSGLGNGSTEAGAKKLHDMMDKVRVDRTGTKKQGKQIDADNYIPGEKKTKKKAAGGIAAFAEGGQTDFSNYFVYDQEGNQVPMNTLFAATQAQTQPSSTANTSAQGYNPDYYNQQFYQDQLPGAQQKVASAQTALSTAQGLPGFDAQYYLAANPDVANSGWASKPHEHYLKHGLSEGRSPFEGGQAGAQLQDPAAIAAAQSTFDTAQSGLSDVQSNLNRLANTPIKYDPYTISNRPSSAEPQFYGNIYKGATPDYRQPGSTLSGNLGKWSNVAGEAERAARPASINQQTTQAYLQNLGRAPENDGFNYWMQSGMSGPQIQQAIASSPEAQNLAAPVAATGSPVNEEAYISGLYQQYLGRAPEAEGLQYWQNQLGPTLNQEQLQQAIMKSPEGQAYAAKQAAAQPKAEAPKEEEKKRKGGILAAKR